MSSLSARSTNISVSLSVSSGDGTDTSAIHTNVASEITGLTLKETLESTDNFVIENVDGAKRKLLGSAISALITGITSFDLTGDSGTSETVGDGETITIAGGTGIDTVVSATNTITASLDAATQSSLAQVATNASNIATNTSNIATNTSNIATNVTAIAARAIGAASSTDNAISRFDGTSGKQLQNSAVTIDDSGTMAIPAGQAIQFTTGGAEPTRVTGKVFWDETNQCLAVHLAGSDVTLQIGLEDIGYFRNSTGSEIPNGTPVSVTDALGGHLLIEPTDISDNDSALCYAGLTTEAIPNNSSGYVACRGKVREVDTSTFSEGDFLYVGAGATIQNTTPAAPNYICKIGRVVTQHAINGVILVHSHTNPKLEDISDVNGGSPSNTNVIKFNSSNSVWEYGAVANTEVTYPAIGSPTLSTLQDISDYSDSAGVLTGGVISDGGSGTINISLVQGIVKTTDSATGANRLFTIAAATGVALTDSTTNYVYVDYNAGTPQFAVSTSNTANGRTTFNLGKVYREGTSVDILNSGIQLNEFQKRVQQHHVDESMLHFTSGAVVSEVGTRNLACTSGVMYAGLNRLTSDAVNTSTGDTFEYYYYNGSAWVESDATQISNTQYNNVATGLANLTVNRYGVHWYFQGTTRQYVLYGQGDYTLTQAQAATVPSSLPSHVSNFGVLRAKIIIQQGASTFTEVDNIRDTAFVNTTPANHNELGAIQGGTSNEYYHLTAAQYTANVTGPGSSTDNAIVRWDGTTGKLVQNSGVTIWDDAGITASSLSLSGIVYTGTEQRSNGSLTFHTDYNNDSTTTDFIFLTDVSTQVARITDEGLFTANALTIDNVSIDGSTISSSAGIEIGSNGGNLSIRSSGVVSFYTDTDNNQTDGDFRFFTNDVIGGSPTEVARITDEGLFSCAGSINVVGRNLVLNKSGSDATYKEGNIFIQHYNTAEEDVRAIYVGSGVGSTPLSIGGGSSSYNAVTEIQFYTASGITTTNGTLQLSINSSGVATFTQHPVGPSSAPTTDYQLANKKYVDDNIAGGGMTSFSLAADTGTPETITNGQTVTIAGSGAISTAVGATDTVTITLTSTSIKLDDLGAPDDNTDLNVSTTAHGLVPKAPNNTMNYLAGDGTWDALPCSEGSALTDYSTDAVASTTVAKWGFYLPYAMTLTEVYASAETAPTGQAMVVDVHYNGNTVFTSTKCEIAASSNTGSQTTLTITSLAKGGHIEFFIDQVGSTIAGAGVTAHIIGTRA